MTDNAVHSKAHDDHSPKHYVKIWFILLILFIVSYLGPDMAPKIHDAIGLNPKFVVLFTAFGIAIVKAYLVIKNFMHLNVEKRFVSYILASMLLMMVVFFSGVAPDVLHHSGTNWVNVAVKKETARAEAENAAAAEHGEGGHAEPAAPEH